MKLGTYMDLIGPNNFKPAQMEVGYFGLNVHVSKPASNFYSLLLSSLFYSHQTFLTW